MVFENQRNQAKPGDIIMMAIFLSVPLLGSPLMLAIGTDFISNSSKKTRDKVSDVSALLGLFIAYHLAIVILFEGLSGGKFMFWLALSLPISYIFCEFCLASENEV